MHTATLKDKFGDIKSDKQITVESRAKFTDEVSNICTEEFDSNVENDADNKGGSTYSEELYSSSLAFDDYRSIDNIISINEKDALDGFQDIPGIFDSNINDAPLVNSGGETIIDVSQVIPGSMDYVDIWKRINQRIGEFLSRDPKKITRWEYRRIHANMAKINKALSKRYEKLEAKEKAIEKNPNSGIEISEREIKEYETLHETYNGIHNEMQKVDVTKLDGSDRPDLDQLPDPEFVYKPPELKKFKSTVKDSGSYRSGTRSIMDTSRKFRRFISSTRDIKKK